MSTKSGKLTTNGVKLLAHEKRAVDILLAYGHDISLIPPSNHPTADFTMDHQYDWELKTLKTSKFNSAARIISKATRLSPNIVIDLTPTSYKAATLVNGLTRVFYQTKNVKRLIIICSKQKILDFSK